MKNKIEQPFNTIPHVIKTAFNDKALSVPEKNLLLHLRMMADPYGKVVVTADMLRGAVFDDNIKRGTVNKHIASLREKKWISYRNRQGVGSQFQIELDVWLYSEKVWRYISGSPRSSSVGSVEATNENNESEVTKESGTDNRKLPVQKDVDLIDRNKPKSRLQIGSSYTDTDNDINTYKSSYSSPNTVNDVLVADFIPQTQEHERLLVIAKAVGDKSMGCVLGYFNSDGVRGLEVMEQIIVQMNKKGHILNRGAYFNRAVQNQLK